MSQVQELDVLKVCVHKDPVQLAEDLTEFAADTLLEGLNAFDDEMSGYAEECREHINQCISRVNRRMKVDPPGIGWFEMYGSDIHTCALTYNDWLEAGRILRGAR